MKNNDDIPTTDTTEIKQLISRVKQGELDHDASPQGAPSAANFPSRVFFRAAAASSSNSYSSPKMVEPREIAAAAAAAINSMMQITGVLAVRLRDRVRPV